MTLRFFKPAITEVTVEVSLKNDDIARIQSEVDPAGKADFSLGGEIRDTNGDVVATSRGLYQIRRFEEENG